MNTDALARPLPAERRGPALTTDARAVGLRRRVVDTSRGRVVVHVGEDAASTAVILLHGAAGSWTTWTPLLRTAERDGDPVRGVVAVDLPGWGESPSARAGGRLDAAAAADIVVEVAHALGCTRWTLVGHSSGGFLALEIAARHPGETDAVLLVSPSGAGVLHTARHVIRGGLALPAFAGMLLTMRLLAALGPVGRRIAPALHRAGLLRPLAAPLFFDPARTHRTVIDALAAEIRPRAFVDAARAAARHDETTWNAIACPVRSLRGERDVFVGAEDGILFATQINDFAESTVRSAGHFAAVEQPEVVLGALRVLRVTSRVS